MTDKTYTAEQVKPLLDAANYYARFETHGFIGEDKSFYPSDDAPIHDDQGDVARKALATLRDCKVFTPLL